MNRHAREQAAAAGYGCCLEGWRWCLCLLEPEGMGKYKSRYIIATLTSGWQYYKWRKYTGRSVIAWASAWICSDSLLCVLQHGGGYTYRLAPADGPLTEAVFQKMPLG